MTNKELYDEAVKNGLAFRYFKGEEECPEDFEDSIQEEFWNLEADCAERNYGNYEFPKGCFADDTKHDEETSDENEKRIPAFITNASASDAEKTVAYDCYADFRYQSNGIGAIKYSKEADMSIEELDNQPPNWDRGFSTFFN